MTGDWVDGWGWASAFCWIFGMFFWALIGLGAVALAKWFFASPNNARRDLR